MLRFDDDAGAAEGARRRQGRERRHARTTSPRCRSPRARRSGCGLGLRPCRSASTCAAASICCTRWTSTARSRRCSKATSRTSAARCATANIPFTDVNTLTVDGRTCPTAVRVTAAGQRRSMPVRAALAKVHHRPRAAATRSVAGGPAVEGVLTAQQIRERQDYAITANIKTLRNRVNELGVSEPIVQRQGLDRINVQLPGVQNSAEVKDILGKVATLEFRLEDPRRPRPLQRPRAARLQALRPRDRGQRRQGPAEARRHRHRRPAHRRRPPAPRTGPAVPITLDARGGEEMLKTTRANLGKPHGRGVHREEPRDRAGRRQAGHARRHGREGHQRRHHPRRVQQSLPDHRPAA